MKLIAANMVDKVDSFLHAGYVSAYPRPLESYDYPLGSESMGSDVDVIYHMDLVEALRLEGESLAAGLQTGGFDTAVAAGFVEVGASNQLLVGTLALSFALALFYLISNRFGWRLNKLVPVAASIVMLMYMIPHCDTESDEPDPLPTEVPWQGVQLESYADPEDATIAILHGIIVPAVANVGQGVEVLPNIQNEVGLPTKQLTKGQAYALSTYGIDGFGKAFRLTRNELRDEDEHKYWGYTVTSAGADGIFDNKDDIAKSFDQTINEEWGWHRNTYYLAKDGDDVVVLFHRWNADMFQYKNEAPAKRLTGLELFDLFTSGDFKEDQLAAINNVYNEIADKLDYNPLILQVFN
ncbi:MAG: hypothetical protein GY847_07255 [Proteobacteria bacterium]|nr:hypothetical protein [Pseudomonadota bacterium]